MDSHNKVNLIYLMAERVMNNDVSESDKQFVKELFEESNYLEDIIHFKKMNLPVASRKWGHMYNPPSSYFPTETPTDATMLYDSQVHYIYVQSTNIARYGESYWISVDSDNTLYSLPIIKAFKEFDFEVGGFYRIECTNTIRWGDGDKRKYVMDIVEIDEETFIKEGVKSHALNKYH